MATNETLGYAPSRSLGIAWPKSNVLFFVLLCVVPTLLVGGYYGLIARPGYLTTVQFGVRPAEPTQVKSEGAGIAQSVPFSSEVGVTSYGVVRYLESDAFVRDLGSRLNLQVLFGRDRGDILDHLAADADSEQKLRYLKRKIKPYFDITTGLVSVNVEAFSADDSYRLSLEVLKISEGLINDISDRIRRDAVATANRDVDRASRELNEKRRELAKKRTQYGIIDQSAVALSNLQFINKLEDDLVSLEAQKRAMGQELNADSPVMKNLNSKIKFITARIEQLNNSSGLGASARNYAPRIEELENLKSDITVLEKLFASATDARQRQITNAERQSLYLVKFVDAVLPDSATRPHGWRAVLLTLIGGLLMSVIAVFARQATKDHLT